MCTMILVTVLAVIMLAGMGCSGCWDHSDTPITCCHPKSDVDLTYCSVHDVSFKDTVEWTVSEIPGNLDVKFALSNEGCDMYLVDLMLLTNVSTSEECLERERESLPGLPSKKHSRRILKAKNFCNETAGNETICGKRETVTFHHVFDGCYQLKVTPKTGSSSRQYSHSMPTYLKTNHKKMSLVEFIPTFRPQDHPSKLHSQVTIAFAPLARNQLHMDIKLIEKIDLFHGEACYKTGQEHTVCSIGESGTATCSTNGAKEANCSVLGTSVECLFNNVTAGHYCITLEIKDFRCCSDTVWVPDSLKKSSLCLWTLLHNVSESSDSPDVYVDVKDPTANKTLYLIIGVVVAIIILLMAIFGICLRLYIIRHNIGLAIPELSLDPLRSNESKRIFLLYARDCQPFMDLMATLREVLEAATKSEVIDCLDASRWNEVGRSPMEWVRGQIEQSNVKVVLVATKCAYLRQQAHLNQATVIYKQPCAYDNLFIYGLKILTENLSQDIYRKISVIRFEGFSDDQNLFNHLTPYTRFVLPAHLPKLIDNLQQYILRDQDTRQVETKEVQLNQDLSKLIDFQNKNVKYIQDLLTIQR